MKEKIQPINTEKGIKQRDKIREELSETAYEEFTLEDIDKVIEETKERIDEVNEINQKPKSWFKKRTRTR